MRTNNENRGKCMLLKKKGNAVTRVGGSFDWVNLYVCLIDTIHNATVVCSVGIPHMSLMEQSFGHQGKYAGHCLDFEIHLFDNREYDYV